jgi:hypothetical protein
MSSQRLAPLSGIVFVICTVLGFIVISGSTPGLDDSTQSINSYWMDNHGKEMAAALVVFLGTLFLAIFVASLYTKLRDADSGSLWPMLALIGGGVAVAGFLFAVTTHVALADAGDKHIDPSALVALNALDNDNFFTFAPPLGIMMLGAGAATLKAGALPKWLGWTGLLLGIISFTPVGFAAFALAGLWIIAVSIVMSRSAAAA